MKRSVVITGVGAVTPLGVGARTLFDGWCESRTGIVDGMAPCSDYEPGEHLSRKEVRRADRCTQLAIVAGNEAVADAGWDEELPCPAERIGCVIGTGVGGIGTIEDQHDILREKGKGALSPLGIPLMMANAPSGVLAMRHGLLGQCFGTVSACAAGAHAVGTALRMIQYGDADACLVGGSEAGITPLASGCFDGMGATSESGECRPFDARRDGFILGEGAGVLCLEDEETAKARGARILARVSGYGATADAHHITAPHPEGIGAARAIKLAMGEAGIEPDQLDYVNAHGTSTPLNDRSETEAIKLALGEDATTVPVSSTKSAIGHLLGAAGAVEAIATAYALSEETAGPTIGWEEREEGMDLDYIPGGPRKLRSNGRPPAAISNSFGFGGHNAVIAFEGVREGARS